MKDKYFIWSELKNDDYPPLEEEIMLDGEYVWSLRAEWLIAGFCSMKRLGVFVLPLDGMVVHRRSLPNNSLVPIYVCVLPKNTTQCPRPGLEPGRLAPESSTLTGLRPPRGGRRVHVVIRVSSQVCISQGNNGLQGLFTKKMLICIRK